MVLVPTWKKHKFANNAVTGISENVRKNNAVISENVRKNNPVISENVMKNNAVISENVRKNNAVISENVRKNNAVISEMKTQFRVYRYRYCMLLTFWKPRFFILQSSTNNIKANGQRNVPVPTYYPVMRILSNFSKVISGPQQLC